LGRLASSSFIVGIARRKTKDAVQAIKRHRAISPEELLAEALLHAVIRQSLGSEPIACKLFYQSGAGLRSFGSAHIVHAETGDELWLGRATVATAASYKEVVAKVLAEVAHVRFSSWSFLNCLLGA
jgi:hypothetical protein